LDVLEEDAMRSFVGSATRNGMIDDESLRLFDTARRHDREQSIRKTNTRHGDKRPSRRMFAVIR
jgi:hypothetical protein